jgi:hypothetical protein
MEARYGSISAMSIHTQIDSQATGPWVPLRVRVAEHGRGGVKDAAEDPAGHFVDLTPFRSFSTHKLIAKNTRI